MPVMHTRFSSKVLGHQCSMNIFVPDTAHPDGKAGFPVVYLLHGRGDDECSYTDHGMRIVCEKFPFIVVMPDGSRSFYTNLLSGERYWDLISEEIPQLIQTVTPARKERLNTFAAGLSMGGYGALKLGLTYPERFGKIGAMSAVADIAWVGRKAGGMSDAEVNNLFGSRTGMTGTENDLFTLLEKPVPASGRPELMLRCGDADGLVDDNREFVRRAQLAGNWQVDYAETPGIGHCWEFWMEKIVEIFDFFNK